MWNLLLNEDERMIADSVREYLARELPIERLRPKAAGVDLAQLRAEMVGLGWFAVGLPEEAGGSGLGLVEEMLVQRECGRYLVSPGVLARCWPPMWRCRPATPRWPGPSPRARPLRR
jgi:alkylation response protein AidB-like acyl-CoA dehydrogenase